MKYLLFLAAGCCALHGFAQKKARSTGDKSSPVDSVILKDVKYRLVGPFRGGRAAAVAGSYTKKNIFYFGAVGGGVWKTIDGGSNWNNVSDKFFGGTMGAVAIAPSDESVVYAGEGENTMRGNVSEGLGGMWRSDDAGRTWKNIGLKESRHIVRIVVHPHNPDIVWAAVMGHLFGPNDERGIYKTIDGGRNWKHVLFVNKQAGCSELTMEPGNPSVFYAGTWNLLRTPYSLESGGAGSGLWKSTDGGDTWKNISENKGLPKGVWGITTVAVAPSNTDKIYAIIENAAGGLYVSENAGETWTLQCSDNNIRQRAWYYSKIAVDPKNENIVYCPNVNLMKSVDGGKTFKAVNTTPHGDHHELWIDPEDGNRMIVADDGGAQVSFDGAASWSTYGNQPTAQFYRLSTDNHVPYRILAAQQDNSAVRILSRSAGAAITDEDWSPTAGGESGYIVADPQNPDVVYGGSYGGFLQRLDHKTEEARLLNIWPDNPIGAGADVQKYRFQWNYPIFFSPHNPKRLYAAGNHLFVTENEGKSWQEISPDLTTNDKSRQVSSGGLITKDNTGVEYYCTIFTAAESSLEKDLLWTGSDDGLINVSKDGGQHWENVTPKDCPKWMMWNCVEADPFKKGTAYFAGTRYKMDDFKPYIFKTEDYGKSWKQITNGIPALHFTRAIRADKKRKGLLYAGTEYGMYISYDDGANWKSFQLNLPVCSITDLLIRNNDLIVATQGRAIYMIDNLNVVQEKDSLNASGPLHIFSVEDTYRLAGGGRRFGAGVPKNAGANPPKGVVIRYYVPKLADSAKVLVEIQDKDHRKVKTFSTKDKDNKLDLKPGLNAFNWDMMYPVAEKLDGLILWNGYVGGPMAAPGHYYAQIVTPDDSTTVPFTIVADPNYQLTQAEYQEQFDFLLMVRDKFSEMMKTQKQIRELRTQMTDFATRNGKDLPASIKTRIDSVSATLTSIEEALHQTKAKSGQDVLNYPIRLDDKLSGLYDVAATGFAAPSKQVKETYADLAKQTDVQLARFKTVLTTDVPALNKMINEGKVEVIGVKKDDKE